jgi:hypothetical protein
MCCCVCICVRARAEDGEMSMYCVRDTCMSTERMHAAFMRKAREAFCVECAWPLSLRLNFVHLFPPLMCACMHKHYIHKDNAHVHIQKVVDFTLCFLTDFLCVQWARRHRKDHGTEETYRSRAEGVSLRSFVTGS